MKTLLTLLALLVAFALHRRPPGDGPGRPPDAGDPTGRPSQQSGNINAANGVTSAQQATGEAATRGRAGQGAGTGNPQGRPTNQWGNVQGNPPNPANININPGRRVHILDGDGDGVGGGHAPGTGLPNKTEFPDRWEDDVIIDQVVDVARNPDQPPIQQDNDRWVARGTRDGVDIEVVINPDGTIWTAYPTGGRGVVRNDENGNPITDE